MKKNEREESLGTRLKKYEKEFESRIDPKDFIICRLDGHKFSKYTKGFRRPFDEILSSAMQKTSEALLEKFGAVTAYKQSDEITLVFPPQYKEKLKPITYRDIQSSDGMCQVENIPEYRVFDLEDNYIGYVEAYYEDDDEGYGVTDFFIIDTKGKTVDKCSLQGKNKTTTEKTEATFSKYLIKEVEIKNEQIFGGRIQKIASLFASFATMTFNKELTDLYENYFAEMSKKLDKDEFDTSDPELMNYFKMLETKIVNAWFDCRVFGVKSKEEAFNAVMWRVRDAEKNSRSMFAQTYCSHKSLLNKTGIEQVQFCKETTGKDWESVDTKFKYGILTKREKYQKVTNIDHIQVFSDVETVERTRIVSWSEKLTTFSDEAVDKIVRKYL